ncbi:hypothetical protein KEJ18_00430 [Candidatus Bathyarchaeota archaeon]|nr:hypothetical protein [Candidatus Bathyarchaeota archaeon]
MSIDTSERTRNIGIMKAVGSLADAIYQYFTIEYLIMVLVGCSIGTLFGIILCFVSTGVMNYMGFPVSMSPLNLQMVLLIFALFVGFSFILSLRLVGRVARVKPAEALTQVSDLTTTQKSTLRLPFLLGKILTARIALRTLSRRWFTTARSITCLDVIIVLMIIIVIGGIVAEETMFSYIQRAVGTNVVLVAKTEIAERYEQLLDRFLQIGHLELMDYLNENFAVPSSVIAGIQGIQGVLKVDPRLILEGTVKEVQLISPDYDNPGQYIVVGDARQCNATVMGIQAETLVNNWLVLGQVIQNNDTDSVLLGDTLAANFFEDPFVQSFKLFDYEFNTVGVCLDSLDNGMVVYMAYEKLSSIVHYSGYNIILIQVEPSNRSETLEKISDALSGSGLVVVDSGQSLNRQLSYVSQIWSMLLSLSLLSFVSAVTSLVRSLMLSVSSQQRDLGIMRALGANPGTILRTVLFQTFILVSAGALFGFPVGLAIILLFLIPEPVVSQNAVVAMVLLISGLITALCLTSLYSARKAAKTPVMFLMA